MSSQSNINHIIFNQLSESKYNQIIPEEGEFYCTTDTNIATKDWTESRLYDIMNDLYPVGSIYIGVTAECPIASLISSSVWELVAKDRVLQGSSSTHTAGSTIEAGLPNIKTENLIYYDVWGFGRLGIRNGGNLSTDALYRDTSNTMKNRFTNVGQYNLLANGTGTDTTTIGFDASRSSSIYGNSNTVQPPAYVVNIWKRTA